MHEVKRIAVMTFVTVLLMWGGAINSADALLATHDCSFCHNFHGSPGYSGLLIAENSELVCLSCHTVSINSTSAVEVHNPLGLASGDSGYITCRECHDAHDSSASNVKMVGYKHDAQNWSASFTPPAIRKEVPSTVGLTYNVVTFTGPTDFNISGAEVGSCEVCHAVNHKVGEDCTTCHGHDTGFASPGTGCLGCHDGSDSDAPVVTDDSPHAKNTLLATTSPDTFDCVDCHTNHNSGTVEVPNNSTVGIQYSQNGEGGIALGSATVPGNTEAEICWNCHATYGVSEWGVNTDTNGGASNYDFGSLSGAVAPAWVNTAGDTGADWTSAQAKFAYKAGKIQSTHSVNGDVTGAGLDPVATIRCSYCHDVHDTAGIVGDVDGKPYLRGSWMGSPYREDGTPQVGDVWTENVDYGAVPRGGTQSIELGGYQIDQNNGNPTTGGNPAHLNPVDPSWALANSAGLCTLCHGSDVDNLNQFGTAADAWVGTNGHANAVIGGTGTASGLAANIFSMAIRNPSGAPLYTSRGSSRGYPRQSYANAGSFDVDAASGDNSSDNWGYGFRSQNSGGFRLSPQTTASFPQAYDDYNWGASVDDTLDNRYHKFSCSKCHNPHASRLPRLLITNCLDTKQNDWDDQASVDTLGTTTSYAPENRGVTFAMATSAQNCHRLADTANFSNATGNGWNLVSPWTVEGTQDNPGIQ
jgi:predicted CXXCH cytochrome family protein